MGSPGLFDGLCELLYIYIKKKKKKKKKNYLNMAEKMLRNVSELMLASVSHYEILEGERFGPKFAPSEQQFVCFSLWGRGVLVDIAQLICLFVLGLL